MGLIRGLLEIAIFPVKVITRIGENSIKTLSNDSTRRIPIVDDIGEAVVSSMDDIIKEFEK